MFAALVGEVGRSEERAVLVAVGGVGGVAAVDNDVFGGAGSYGGGGGGISCYGAELLGVDRWCCCGDEGECSVEEGECQPMSGYGVVVSSSLMSRR